MFLVDLIYVVFFMLLLLCFHELGHVVAARLLGLPIEGIGVALRPYPHVFVAVAWTTKRVTRYVYLFSGTAITLILFLISFFYHFFGLHALTYAFAGQLILETNPFYSDFTIAIVTAKLSVRGIDSANHYQSIYRQHAFSPLWYLHFSVWSGIILSLITLIL